MAKKMAPAMTSMSPRRGLEPPERRLVNKETKTRMIMWLLIDLVLPSSEAQLFLNLPLKIYIHVFQFTKLGKWYQQLVIHLFINRHWLKYNREAEKMNIT